MDPMRTPNDKPLESDGDIAHSDEGLDWYDRLLAQTFPASDSLPLWTFDS